MALGLLEQKIHARLPVSSTNSRPSCCMPIWCSLCGCASIAKRGVWRATAMDGRLPMTMRLLGRGDSQVLRWLEAEKDPRRPRSSPISTVVEGRVSDERDGGVQSAEP